MSQPKRRRAGDRRAVFFLISAVACAILIIPCPEEVRWVGVVLTVGYSVLAVASYLDHRSRSRFSN